MIEFPPYLTYAALLVLANVVIYALLYVTSRLVYLRGMGLLRALQAHHDARLLRDTLRRLDADGLTKTRSAAL